MQPSGAPGPHPVRAAAAGVGAGGVCLAILETGALPEAATALLILVLVCLVPVCHGLSGRIAVNAALLVGWMPVLWWVRWPVPVNHGGVVVAAVVGGLSAYVAAGEPRRRAATLLPTVRGSDALLPGALLAALAATAPLTFAATPLRALNVLVPGADNYAHFAMFTSLRAYGATPDVIGAGPDGSGWAFADYPKAFHALVASISEVTVPRMPTGPDSLVVYAHTVGLVVALGLLMVTAAILSLPHIGGRPAIAVPVVVMTWTALLWEPGQKVLANGFASFWLGAVAAGCALLVGVGAARVPAVVRVAAVGGLLVCVSHTWTPLVVVAAPAALAVLVRDDMTANPDTRRRRRALCLAVLALSAVAALKSVVTLLGSVSVGDVVSEVSGFDGTSPIPTFVLFLALLYVLVSYRTWVRQRTGSPLDRRTARELMCLTLAPTVGFVFLAVLLVIQVQTLGTTSYYFLKLLLGFELVLACVTPAVCGMLLAAVTRPSHRRGVAGLSLAATLLATQLFVPVSLPHGVLFSDTDDGTAAINAPYSRLGIATGVLTAVDGVSPAESFHREYLPLGSGNAVETFYPDGWYHAVNASVTNTVWERFDVLRAEADTVAEAAPLVRRLLAREPDLRIAVESAYVAPLREHLGSPALADRVVSIE